MRKRRGKQSIHEISKDNCFIPLDAKEKIRKARKGHPYKTLLIN
jgi:hypothetical protein